MTAVYRAADGDLRVLFAIAAEAEYGPELQALIKPIITGVGPVEAAIRVTLALTEDPADIVISMGSAGSRSLAQANIYQVSSVAYRDMDASPLGFEKGLTPFLGLPAVLPIYPRLPGVPEASLSTGGAIVNGEAYDAIVADMVDMESYAVFRAASLCGASMIGLRGISDGRDPISKYSDWTQYLHDIDAALAAIVRTLPDTFAARPKSYWTGREG